MQGYVSVAHGDGLIVGGDDRLYDRGAESPVLQRAHPLDGGAAGGADPVFQRAGVGVLLQHQLGGALHHLGRVGQGFVPGQAAGHSTVGNGLNEDGAEGGAAAGHSAGGVQPVRVDPVHQTRGGEQGLEGVQFLLCGVQPVVLDHTGPHRHRGVGHKTDHRVLTPGHSLDALGVQPSGHGGQDKPVCPGGARRLYVQGAYAMMKL